MISKCSISQKPEMVLIIIIILFLGFCSFFCFEFEFEMDVSDGNLNFFPAFSFTSQNFL